ncbi:MAG: crystallin J1 [Anaerolineaceae bacterium]|nr:crystallin J1 [Anaerolineaceae bacterium]
MNLQNALLSLDGLSVGDAFGERFFVQNPIPLIQKRILPEGIWKWTDDTHMALSLVEILTKFGKIDQDALIRQFSRRFIHDGRLGYGRGAALLLERVFSGENWAEINTTILKGGSYGNGAAMRVPPLGAFFADDLERVVSEASLSAEVTHAHPEGIAGAVAIAVAAALAAQPDYPTGIDFIKSVHRYVPDGLTKDGILRSVEIPAETEIESVVELLGNGTAISAQDTVPFCVWCAAHHLDNYEEALWKTISGLGDRDTTCAMVGGIVALSAKTIPQDWLTHREPFPGDFMV